MAAAAVPAAVNNYAVPAPVLDGLLSRYKFISTSLMGNQEVFVWQEKDPYFRSLQVTCSGYAALNDGAVYVNGEILSMISGEELTVQFDCSMETFNSVMTFAHSMNRKSRTLLELLELLPLVRDCNLPLLFETVAFSIVMNGGYEAQDGFVIGLRSESYLLFENTLQCFANFDQLCACIRNSNVFGTLPNSVFVNEANRRILRLIQLMPVSGAHIAVGGGDDPARDAFHENFRTIYDATLAKMSDSLPNFSQASPHRDYEIKLGDESIFVSREILAQASRYFHRQFYGDFAAHEKAGIQIDNVSTTDHARLVYLLLPTVLGVLYRLSASPPAPFPGPSQSDRMILLKQAYRCLVPDFPTFFRLFELAHFYQMEGLVGFMTDVAVHCLPWRERLQLADKIPSREIMVSLLTEKSLEEICASDDRLEGIGQATKGLLFEYFALSC